MLCFDSINRKETSMLNGQKDIKSKRLNIYVTEEVDNVIRTKSKENGMLMGDYIIERALSFELENIPEKLSETIALLNRIKRRALDMTDDKTKKNVVQSSQKQAEMNKQVKEAVSGVYKTKGFHLRVTEETYEKLKKKAAEYSMSLSDYVVFVITYFDVEKISNQIDTINNKLTEIETHIKNN